MPFTYDQTEYLEWLKSQGVDTSSAPKGPDYKKYALVALLALIAYKELF